LDVGVDGRRVFVKVNLKMNEVRKKLSKKELYEGGF